ncbi:MAG: acetyl-CoA synthase subunit gamma [Candidatus Eisenbacteria bacterium]|uniref:Acetyl-CoA synthase subunit gamma n=1 Tax=Eiseniibacteriota bacterium TaxID=2212470 RepID=A0A948RYD6_UNCEI|nr:acetyl-CoA synthase subunit gamma [Candidatus Eisenbacteria bacterium]MBU1950743.1 acetyl-CoA synthase subunit gamma [Candidatus Eisenbacteria bacterium]MBU2693120.1 acetyl-CoA synthase subunit gamma [Candidatus Eisenbacteria bacterium]
MKVRWNIGRMNYAVPPGLYAAGHPTTESPVLVTANYKLTFDSLRKDLGRLDAWILVLDTKGINVWCAAGKGTFGTGELIHRVQQTRLAEIVSHRELILPQLGAPGVAAHEIKKGSGFRVIYGPVLAGDIRRFLENGKKATPGMRRVRFDLPARLAVVPVELVQWCGYTMMAMVLFLLLAGIHRSGYDPALLPGRGLRAALLIFIAYLAGGVVTPMLLPWIPGRAFFIKGALIGLALVAIFWGTGLLSLRSPGDRLEAVAWLMLTPAITAFMAMNYTGASTYTSLSGVKREMHFAVPAQIAGAVIGLVFWIARLFFV